MGVGGQGEIFDIRSIQRTTADNDKRKCWSASRVCFVHINYLMLRRISFLAVSDLIASWVST